MSGPSQKQEAAKSGKVAAVLDDKLSLVINLGAAHGVAVGQRFLVYAIGGEVKDPDTGESLGRLEIVRGTGKVTHVQERMATIGSDMKSPASRTITRKGGLLALMTQFGQVEEVLPAESVPFEEPQIGDIVKFISS
jgi:hypothetical protein